MLESLLQAATKTETTLAALNRKILRRDSECSEALVMSDRSEVLLVMQRHHQIVEGPETRKRFVVVGQISDTDGHDVVPSCWLFRQTKLAFRSSAPENRHSLIPLTRRSDHRTSLNSEARALPFTERSNLFTELECVQRAPYSRVVRMSNFPVPTDEALERLKLVVSSFGRLTGRQLVDPSGSDLWQACWSAPRVIVAHGSEADPVFFYGNELALDCFEMDFADVHAIAISLFRRTDVARRTRRAAGAMCASTASSTTTRA